MENRPNWPLLARYVAGECSPEEEQRVERWICADPSREQLIEELRSIWEAADAPRRSLPQVDVESGWEEVRAEMDPAPSNESTDEDPFSSRSASRTERRPSRRRAVGWRVGVVAGLFLLLGGLWLVHSFWGGRASTDSTTRTVVTEQGERSQIQLADGSSVMLNVDSELRLPSTFNQEKRVVELKGEAYFEVEADTSRPFIVRTEEASVTVRGTAFNVRGYPDDEQVAVAVAEGGVSFRPDPDDRTIRSVRLNSGEVGRTAEADTIVETVTTDVTAYIGWTEGRLVFDDTPLPEVARRLERWYNLDVQIRDSALRSLHLTATLKSQSIENVLDVLAASLDIQYDIDREVVVLRSRERAR